MKFDAAILQMAEDRLLRKRRQAENDAEQRRLTLHAAVPRLAEIHSALTATGTRLVRVVLKKDPDAKEQIEQIKQQNLALQDEYKELLMARNVRPEELRPAYACRACSDEGYIDGKMCECLKLMIKQCAYERLNTSIPLADYTFDRFSLDYYTDSPDERGLSPYKRMAHNFQVCKSYAQTFHPQVGSLLLMGATGLGKTHLSLSIANEVIAKGYGVVYGSIQNLTSQIEKEKFGRASQPEDTMENLLGCDLLILDDMGTEFLSTFVLSAIQAIVNTRLLKEKPTIISTNLSLAELEDRYGERIVSRMIGGYQMLAFAGSDVRQKKRQQSGMRP